MKMLLLQQVAHSIIVPPNMDLISNFNVMSCLTLERIPQVFASFLESSAMWYFPLRCSSNRTPKNLKYFAVEMCFLPVLMQILDGSELADEWKIIKLVLFIFRESLFASSHLFISFSPLLTFLMTSSSVSKS